MLAGLFALLPLGFAAEVPATGDAVGSGNDGLAEDTPAIPGEGGASTVNADGSTTTLYPDGTVKTTTSDGYTSVTTPDGTTTTYPPANPVPGATPTPDTTPETTPEPTPVTPGTPSSGDGTGRVDAPPTAEPVPSGPPGLDLTGAVPIGDGLTKREYSELKPKRGRLPPNPRHDIDYTAYTLEWGEVKVGFPSLTVGVLPRTQVSTILVLDTLGVYNGTAKVNPLQLGPVDLSINGSYFGVTRTNESGSANFNGHYALLGGDLSVEIFKAWSVHGGVDGIWAAGAGEYDPTILIGRLTSTVGVDFSGALDPYDATFTAKGLLIHASTDVRFNLRDSIIVQVSGVTSGSSEYDELGSRIPDILGISETFEDDMSSGERFASSYSAAVSYQAAFRHLNLRVGVGTSAAPFAWVLPAFEISYRLGGATRKKERNVRQGWKDNREDLIRRRDSSGEEKN